MQLAGALSNDRERSLLLLSHGESSLEMMRDQMIRQRCLQRLERAPMAKLPLSNRILLHEQKTPPAAPNDLFSAEKEEESSKLGWAEIHKMDRLIEAYGVEARQLSWKPLAYKAKIENVSTRTI